MQQYVALVTKELEKKKLVQIKFANDLKNLLSNPRNCTYFIIIIIKIIEKNLHIYKELNRTLIQGRNRGNFLGEAKIEIGLTYLKIWVRQLPCLPYH